MSFLESVGLNLIKNEKEMLRALREAAEGWYNELTQPFLAVLTADINDSPPRDEERLRLSRLANALLSAEMLINQGDALENRLAEIEKSSGIPLFSKRRSLNIKAVDFLDSGTFLKKLAYGSFKASDTTASYRASIRMARERWEAFRAAKSVLVDEINAQLARIG